MKRRTSAIVYKWLRKLLRSGLSLLKAIAFNITWAILVIGFSYLLTAWGMPLNPAFILADVITVAIWAGTGIVWDKFFTSSKLKGELKLAHVITQALANQKSREWDEYQDWLHDIMLYRQQLLDDKRPRWQVSLIIYWQLGVFGIIVVISKIKQVAAFVRRSL